MRFNGTGDIAAWQRLDTQVYLNVLEHEQRRANTSVKRVLASLRRWAHERPKNFFTRGGLPIRGI